MTESALRSGPSIDSSFAGGSKVRRGWTLFVACSGVALVIASMVALNTALADIAVATSASQTQLTWIVDSYTLLLACLLLPAGAIGDRYGRRTALLVGLAIFAVASFAATGLRNPGADHRRAGARRRGCGVRHACDAVAADVGVSDGGAHQGGRNLGGCGRVRRRLRTARHRLLLLHLLVVAVDLLGASPSRPPRSSCSR